MQTKIIKIILLSSIVLFSWGCAKEKTILPEGDIVGFVNLIDEVGKVVEDKSGVKVTLEGELKTVETNESGRYEFTNVSAGTYDFIFDKPGYGTIKKNSYQFVGGNVPALNDETTIYEIPNIEIQDINVSYQGTKISIHCQTTETTKLIVIAYISESPEVSIYNHDFMPFHSVNISGSSIKGFSYYIYLSNTPLAGLDKVYLVLYFINPEEFNPFYSGVVYSSYKKATSVIELTLE